MSDDDTETPGCSWPKGACLRMDSDLELNPVTRLTRDLRKGAATLGDTEARFLVDAYYIMQENRKRAAGQERALTASEEPHEIITWLKNQNATMEGQIKAALDVYTQNHMMGEWMRCAPGNVEVWTQNRRRVRLDELHDGDRVISFNRHHTRLTRPMEIQVGSRPYNGNLINVCTIDHSTETTPNHRWLVRFNRAMEGVSVYLMRSGNHFRVGRTGLFGSRKEGADQYWRLGVQQRARTERADVWILKVFSTDREAAVYEHFVAAHYGLTETCFRQNRPGGRLGMTQNEIDLLFSMLDTIQQHERAKKCLEDHGRFIGAPLWSHGGAENTQSPTQGIVTHAANIIPELMQVPVPTPVYAGVDWLNIHSAERRPYIGEVYSLDVANHHKYIQDGLITCNSVYGIGPVISAGLLAHIKIERAPTAGHIYSYAGIAGPVTETELKRAIYRVAYRDPVPEGIIPALTLEPPYEATFLYPDGNYHAFFQVVVDHDIAHPAIIASAPQIMGVDRTFRAFSGSKPWSKGEKRPWNAGFKTLCWKAGHSFMMFSNDEKCFYGQMYRRRKEREINKNERGEFRETARIRADTVGKTTDAYKAYSVGILPPAHIDAMARRYTVKIFLSHLHEEWYWRHYGKEAPAPYAIAHLDHAHYIKSPIPRKKK